LVGLGGRCKGVVLLQCHWHWDASTLTDFQFGKNCVEGKRITDLHPYFVNQTHVFGDYNRLSFSVSFSALLV
jgi:hypothetical protein